MPRVLFIQNGDGEGPGLFARVLTERGASLEIVHAWNGEEVPESGEGWAGIVLGGGSMSAYQADEYPFLRDEALLVRAARAQKVPVLGICLGAQLMAGACGGRVFANRAKEIGFHEVWFTAAGMADPLWSAHAANFRPVHWHGDAFSLPPQAELLASSALTPNQLFRLDDRHYGFQFHLEIEALELQRMIEADATTLTSYGVDPEVFRTEAHSAMPAVEPIGRAVFTRWLEMLGQA